MNLLLVFFIAFLGHTSISQQLYGSVSGGYQVIIPEAQPPSPIVNTYHQIVFPWFWGAEDFSFNQATYYSVSLGHITRRNIGYEISGTYLNPVFSEQANEVVTKSFHGNFFRVNPRIVLASDLKKIQLISKLGFLVSYGKINYNQTFRNNGMSNISYDEATLNYEYTGAPSFGFTGCFGISGNVTKKISLFAEIEAVYQSFSPDEGEITEHTIDGQDQLELYNWQPYQTEIEFGDESEAQFWTSSDVSVPQKLYKRNYSLSGVGINFGVKLTLWSKKKVDDTESVKI